MTKRGIGAFKVPLFTPPDFSVQKTGPVKLINILIVGIRKYKPTRRKEMNAKLQMILTKDELNRIKANIRNGKSEVTVDLHHLTVREAKRLLNNIIALGSDCCDIKAIHGYNHGTAIKEMIQNDLKSPRIIARQVSKSNPGLTDIKLAA